MRFFPLILLLFSLLSPLFAQKELTSLLKKIQNDPVEMEFSLEIYWSVREKTEKKKGSLLLAGEENFDLTLEKSRWVSDGVTVWQYSEKNSQLVIRNFFDMDFSLHPSTMFERFGSRKFKEITENDNTILRWSSDEDLEYRKIDVKLSDDNNRFESILFVDLEDNESRYIFKKMLFLDSVEESRFVFTTPKDVEVFDER